jgi:hypothetical protein
MDAEVGGPGVEVFAIAGVLAGTVVGLVTAGVVRCTRVEVGILPDSVRRAEEAVRL